MSDTPRPYAEGERRKLVAHAVLEATREALARNGRRALLNAVLERGQATADDVRSSINIPEGINPVCVGTLPRPLAVLRIIKAAGQRKTARPQAHARNLTVWELAGPEAADKARAWLANHPELPEPPTADEAPAMPIPAPRPDRPTDSAAAGPLFALAQGVAHE